MAMSNKYSSNKEYLFEEVDGVLTFQKLTENGAITLYKFQNNESEKSIFGVVFDLISSESVNSSVKDRANIALFADDILCSYTINFCKFCRPELTQKISSEFSNRINLYNETSKKYGEDEVGKFVNDCDLIMNKSRDIISSIRDNKKLSQTLLADDLLGACLLYKFDKKRSSQKNQFTKNTDKILFDILTGLERNSIKDYIEEVKRENSKPKEKDIA